jgi:hypothetical protein
VTPDWRPKGSFAEQRQTCEVLAESIGESLNGETDGMRDESHQLSSITTSASLFFHANAVQ